MFFELRQYRMRPGKRDEWKNEFDPKVPEMIDRSRTVITRIQPTSRSVIR